MSDSQRIQWDVWIDDYGFTRPVVTVASPSREMLRSIDVKAARKDRCQPPAIKRTRKVGDYADVTQAYTYFTRVGFTPTRDIADLYGVNYTTAAKWVRTARAKGLLSPTGYKSYKRREVSA